jgi:hypothetical protein
MLAICSDLDETPEGSYFEVIRFLNSRERTTMGVGLGLEVGNTIYFDMGPGKFSYWNSTDESRATVRLLIKSGHVDCLHSFGDLATHRRHAGRALDELSKHGCSLKVWVDHAVAPTNLGSDIMHGFGDVRGHDAYHADLTLAYGLRYVWRGRVTSTVGQDRPPSLAGLWTPRHPFASGRTLAKEWAKQTLQVLGDGRYRPHQTNALTTPVRLRDGQRTLEFLRSNPHWGGVSCGDTSDGLADVVTDAFLDRLVRRNACCVLYTHIGKRRGRAGEPPLSLATQARLRGLALRSAAGEVLVTTTRRLLDYHQARDSVALSMSSDGSTRVVNLSFPTGGDTAVPHGLTFYIDAPEEVQIRLNGHLYRDAVCNPPDESGRPSLSIQWPALEFPHL